MEHCITLYEVIRIFNGSPAFLQDNISRLRNSISKSGTGMNPDVVDLRRAVEEYLRRNHVENGNLKYLLRIGSAGDFEEFTEQIPHNYPSAECYAKGVPVSVIHAVRENPEVKYINPSLREMCDAAIAERGVFELLLSDKDGFITEGSRSNVFFVSDGELYTAPDNMVLPGTARKRVLELACKNGIKTHMIPAVAAELDRFDAAFITGTSPLVLPISNIDTLRMNTCDAAMRKIMESYFRLLKY